MAVDSRLNAKIHKLLRRLRRQEDHTKELAEALAEVAEAATALIARYHGDPAEVNPEADRLAEARDKANDLLTKLETG
jgi:hypothetical protein